MGISDSPTVLQHPYRPQSLDIPTWKPPRLSFTAVMVQVHLIMLPLLAVFQLTLRFHPKPTFQDRLKVFAFSFCILMHSFEPLLLLYPDEVPHSPALHAQLLQYYAYVDSRYMQVSQSADLTGVILIDLFIIVPLCMLALYSIVREDLVLEIIASIGAYGAYYSTAILYYRDVIGGEHSVSRLHWLALFAINMPWIVLPAVSTRSILKRLKELDSRASSGQKHVRKTK